MNPKNMKSNSPEQRPGGRHAANNASRRNMERARERSADQPADRINRSQFGRNLTGEAALNILGAQTLKFIPLGGVGEIGRSMNILEYGSDAIVVDAGFKLGIDLPGINYALPDFTYLEKIKHKLKGYVFTHGHLDHVGAMPFLLAKYPAPCYGSRFTLDMLERVMTDREGTTALDKRVINPDTHEKLVIGQFKIEAVRVNHSIPDACGLLIETPVGKIFHTGDFKFDPDPLDGKHIDVTRLKQIGDEGVKLLLSDSTNCQEEGRQVTEKTLIPTIDGLVKKAPGRIIISAVSTNINRIQMIMDVLAKDGRKIAIDGRSMLANVEMAVRTGYIRIARGTVVAMRDIARVPDSQLAIISTGHQGELGSVLMRMASGEHKFVKLKPGDTVVLSASPIPGNEKSVVTVVDRLMREGAVVYQHPTHELDGIGPLHVSGHAKREELSEMMKLIRPQNFIPVHGEYHHEVYHAKLAVANGIHPDNIFILDNGDVFEMSASQAAKTGKVAAGTQLVDQNGDLVPNLVVQDRLLMSQDGIVVMILTLNRKTGAVLTSPDIITRGFVYIKDNEQLMEAIRNELKQFSLRRFAKIELTRFKQELRDHIATFLYSRTNKAPIVIPVVNVIDGNGPKSTPPPPPPSLQQPQATVPSPTKL